MPGKNRNLGAQFDHIGATWRDNDRTEQAKSEFRALPDHAIVTVYHGTTPENAKVLRAAKSVSRPNRKTDLPTMGNGLYVAPTRADAETYGKEVVPLRVRKRDLDPSPEALRVNPKTDVTTAFFHSFDGAVIRKGTKIELGE